MKVTIIGAGVLGTSLGVLLRRAGYEIAAISSLNRRSAQEAASHIGGCDVVGDPGLAALGADVVILAVPDRVIPAVAIEVASGGALKRDAAVVHLAGGLPSGILSGVRAAGGYRGAMHPLQSFADVGSAVRMLPETYFFLEGDGPAVEAMRQLVAALGGKPITIDVGDKALYHAAASVASNFFVTLVDFAVTLLGKTGVGRDVALQALVPLMQGTLSNLESVGLPNALTGPIARGDVGTVRRHLRALQMLPSELGKLYRHLARKTIEVARRKGSLDKTGGEQLLDLLDQFDQPFGDGEL
ncbi:MAG: DUF2520 domain-containing protein [Planctomycetota bacterium]|nr:DUF2520 domain-containing protein [Planctomycetota bacterium]